MTMVTQHASASARMMRGRQRQRGAAWAVLLLLASPVLPPALAAREPVTRPPMTTLTIRSVQCKIPSDGTSATTRYLVGTLSAIATGVAAGTAMALAIPTGGGSLLMYGAGMTAGGVAMIGGGVAGADATAGIDKFVSGTDQLYIKVDGQKKWPKQGQYKDIKSQQTYAVGEVIHLDERNIKHGVEISLFEYDGGPSSDDSMGGFIIYPTQQDGDWPFLVTHEGEGSAYIVNINVARRPSPSRHFRDDDDDDERRDDDDCGYTYDDCDYRTGHQPDKHSPPDPPGVPIYSADDDDG